MSDPVIIAWGGRNLGFSVGDHPGTVEVTSPVGEMSMINLKLEDKVIPLGSLQVEHADGHPDGVSFSALSAAPNIRFKYLQVDVTRQVPVPLLNDTAFYIVCIDNVVKAVMIVDWSSASDQTITQVEGE